MRKCHKLLSEPPTDDRWNGVFDEFKRFSKNINEESRIDINALKLFNHKHQFNQNDTNDISQIIDRFSENDTSVVNSFVINIPQNNNDVHEEEQENDDSNSAIVSGVISEDINKARETMLQFARRYSQNLMPERHRKSG